MSVEVLLFGAHPDDVEWGIGGLALRLSHENISFAIVDLTEGEMGSRGTVEQRRQESEMARRFLGAAQRENLGMPDTQLMDVPENRRKIASVIRRYRPAIILAPFWQDRHPDHAATGQMVRNATLYATLKKLPDENPPHRPVTLLYYLLHECHPPSYIIDISDLYSRKLELLRLYQSQFSKTAEQFGVVPSGLGDYLFGLESRDRYFGSMGGVRYGEALVIDRPLTLQTFLPFLGTARGQSDQSSQLP